MVTKQSSPRLNVLKTYKLFIGGKFPRSESGRYYKVKGKGGKFVANASRASKKDLRDAVRKADEAFEGWSSQPPFKRGQILYRMAEMLEGRKAQYIEELESHGISRQRATDEMETSVDRLVYYAGWSDKFTQVLGSVNPVAGSYFNFSMPEPTGVVGVLLPQDSPMTAFVTIMAATVVGGNTCVMLAPGKYALSPISFAEVLNDSDLPGGVANILTGYKSELLDHFSRHMDINALIYCDNVNKEIKTIQENAAENLKRVIHRHHSDWLSEELETPYLIQDTQEIKTTWHPVGV
jgi:acyl-CoA reductase-like NAD-dependent aldehyde dehydrogenase